MWVREGLCPLMLRYTVHMYVAKKRGQGSGVCISGSSFRDGVPGNTIAWSQRQGVYSKKKNLRPFYVYATTFLSFRSFSFFTYTMNVCCIIQD